MLFWILTGVVSGAGGRCSGPAAVARPRAAPDGAIRDVELYRDQLAEVDRDLARGTLAPDEAERSRIEIVAPHPCRRRARRTSGAAGPRGRDPAGGGAGRGAGDPGRHRWAITVWAHRAIPTCRWPAASRRAMPSATTGRARPRPRRPPRNCRAPKSRRRPIIWPWSQQLRDIVPTRPDDLQGMDPAGPPRRRPGQLCRRRRRRRRIWSRSGAMTPPSGTCNCWPISWWPPPPD